MTMPKFAEGDRVTVMTTRDNPNVRGGVYQVVRPLPETREGRQYRVKNVMEAHERVFHEIDLTAA